MPFKFMTCHRNTAVGQVTGTQRLDKAFGALFRGSFPSLLRWARFPTNLRKLSRAARRADVESGET
jgi:hypothetical protein